MQKRELPNANTVLILGILSIPMCLCYGILGLILGLVAIDLAGKDKKTYDENPNLYSNYSNLTVGKALAIIGVILSTIMVIIMFYLLVFLPKDEYGGFMENLKIKMEQQQQE